jgi:hypothetical protein
MTIVVNRRRWLGPALATALWFGVAPAPFSTLTGGEIAAIWGHTARDRDHAQRLSPKEAQASHDTGPSVAARAPASFSVFK